MCVCIYSVCLVVEAVCVGLYLRAVLASPKASVWSASGHNVLLGFLELTILLYLDELKPAT